MNGKHPSKPNSHLPTPFPNLLLGSLQLLFWLLVHPSAWRKQITRIDPTLPSDFYLAELSPDQWRNPALQQLLIRGYVVWPLLVGLIVWVSGIAEASHVFGAPRGMVGGVAFALALCLALGLAGGLIVSVALGIVGGVVGSLAYSLASIWPGGNERAAALVIATGIAVGIAGSATFSAASAVPGSRAGHRPNYSIVRQVSGIIIGILIGIVGPVLAIRLAISAASNVAFTETRILVFDMANDRTVNLIQGLMLGVAGGLAVGVAVARRIPARYGLALGTIFGVLFGPARVLMLHIAPELAGIGNAALLTALFALCYVLAERVAGPWTGAVAGALGSGGGFFLSVVGDQARWPIIPIGVLCVILGLTLAWWRPILFYPLVSIWNLLLYQADVRWTTVHNPPFLRWHGAFWDEYQRLPFIGLDEHLLLILTRHPTEGQAALDYLTDTPQRWAAQAAQIELDARNLEACTDVASIGQAHRTLAAGDLTGPASALLRSFSRLSQDVDSALRQESAYNQRLALSAVEDRLDGLLREFTRSSEPYAERFRPILTSWRKIIGQHTRHLAATVEIRQEIDNPYIIGVPLTEQQEIFIGRTDISARIEQLLADQRRPPLLLYGQRRMGKTSLLNNLGRLLPTTIIPFFVDLQGAARASGDAGLLYNIGRDMIKSASLRRNLSLPPLPRQALIEDPFTRFDEWLDQVETGLGKKEQTMALLALDEFEALDRAINKGRYDEEDVLGTLRHLIQHRPRFKVLLAGSHHLEEFQRWASYLINVQVVHISYLQEREARQLIERPVEGFALRYEPEASRQLLALTRGHPFLVQLLCAEIVALKNEQEPARRRLASLADIEAAVPEALKSGSFFFADIQRNQVNAAGLAVLRTLAPLGREGSANQTALARLTGLTEADLEKTLAHLIQRELIEAVEGGFRFQVELIRRWFARS